MQNLIFSSDSLRTTESWIPLCLPGISDAGLLQMYCNFFEPNIGIAFITESQEDSYFLKFVDQYPTISLSINLLENQIIDYLEKHEINNEFIYFRFISTK